MVELWCFVKKCFPPYNLCFAIIRVFQLPWKVLVLFVDRSMSVKPCQDVTKAYMLQPAFDNYHKTPFIGSFLWGHQAAGLFLSTHYMILCFTKHNTRLGRTHSWMIYFNMNLHFYIGKYLRKHMTLLVIFSDHYSFLIAFIGPKNQPWSEKVIHGQSLFVAGKPIPDQSTGPFLNNNREQN